MGKHRLIQRLGRDDERVLREVCRRFKARVPSLEELVGSSPNAMSRRSWRSTATSSSASRRRSCIGVRSCVSSTLVEPALIAEPDQGLRELYVALTRTTTTLVVLHARPLPAELQLS